MLLLDDHNQMDVPLGGLRGGKKPQTNILSENAEEDDQSTVSESQKMPGSSKKAMSMKQGSFGHDGKGSIQSFSASG